MSESDRVWRIASVIFDKKKYQILRGLVEGKTVSRVASELGLTRGGIQHHLDALRSLGLLDEGLRPTPLASDLVKLVEETIAKISELMAKHSTRIIEQAVSQFASILASVGISLDVEAIRRLVEEAAKSGRGTHVEQSQQP